MKSVTIDNIEIDQNKPCVVFAELGAMHEDLEGMKKLIKLSKEAGANAVKIQTFTAETLAIPGAEFRLDDGSVISQFDFFKKNEISRDVHKKLFAYAKKQDILMFSTPSHYDDVDFLEELGVPAYKTGSDDLTNYPFLEYIAKKGKPVIVSTGMATLAEVEEAVNTILKAGNEQLILLHCTVSYPPEPKFANLNIMKTLRSAFDLPIGYSDHVQGIFSSVLAASMGACVVEKHITLDRRLKRPDYQVSLEPAELKEMVEQIRLIPVLEGKSVKEVYPCEEKWRLQARKSLVASRNLRRGEILRSEDIKIMRPGTGIHPKYLNFLMGRVLSRDINKHEILKEDAFQSKMSQ